MKMMTVTTCSIVLHTAALAILALDIKMLAPAAIGILALFSGFMIAFTVARLAGSR